MIKHKDTLALRAVSTTVRSRRPGPAKIKPSTRRSRIQDSTVVASYVPLSTKLPTKQRDVLGGQLFLDATQDLGDPLALAGLHHEPEAARATEREISGRSPGRVAELRDYLGDARLDLRAGVTAVDDPRYGALRNTSVPSHFGDVSASSHVLRSVDELAVFSWKNAARV